MKLSLSNQQAIHFSYLSDYVASTTLSRTFTRQAFTESIQAHSERLPLIRCEQYGVSRACGYALTGYTHSSGRHLLTLPTVARSWQYFSARSYKKFCTGIQKVAVHINLCTTSFKDPTEPCLDITTYSATVFIYFIYTIFIASWLKRNRKISPQPIFHAMIIKLFGRGFGDLVTVCGSSWPMTYSWN